MLYAGIIRAVFAVSAITFILLSRKRRLQKRK